MGRWDDLTEEGDRGSQMEGEAGISDRVEGQVGGQMGWQRPSDGRGGEDFRQWVEA